MAGSICHVLPTSLWALLLLFWSRPVASQTVMPSNLTTDISPVDSSPRFLLNGSQVAGMPSIRLAPLTDALVQLTKSNFLTFEVTGNLVNVNANNVHDLTSNEIAYISCDSADYNGYLTPSTVMSFALAGGGSVKAFPQAIILYSEVDNHCNFTIQGNTPIDAIFTTIDPMVAASVAKLNLNANSKGTTGIIPDMNSDTSNNGSSSSTGFGGFGGDGPSPTTAVAMIILYSITGIITALFVIIILTGAVRAHRHPERYGPRAGAAGRAGQSRAKGIARAMLATLPIVKYGDQEPAAVKPPATDSDIEMNAAAVPRSADAEADKEAAQASQTNMGDVVAVPEAEKDKDSASQSSGKAEGAGTVNNADGTQDDGTLGCSICTEDFTRGEEVRVLPCNHKFHPACVDPWLLNVSGTCPLCRIDLRGKPTEETADGEAPLSPPLETDRQASADFGPARNASIPSLIHMRNAGSREERIAALRRFRNATRNSPTPEVAGAEQRQTVTSRLRDRFRIRTTRAREPSVAEERPEAVRRPSAAAISALPTTGAATPAAAELRPLREVYRLGRRNRDQNQNEPSPLIG